MYHSDDFLERIRQTEINKLNKLSFAKLFSFLTIETTKDFSDYKHLKKAITEKKLKPDFLFKYIVLAFGICIFAKVIKNTFFEKHIDIPVLVLGYVLSVFLIYLFLKEFFLDKSLNYEILIDRNGIIIENRTFLWKDVYETAILTIGGGKNQREYFIIALNDMNSYEKFELRNFKGLTIWNFSATLSKYIEYFKATP
ncbi:MAG: hypothetical protein WDM90_14205 [Ferruginibacter sp.]